MFAIPGLVLLGFGIYWVGGVLGFWSGGLSDNLRHALWFTIGFFLFAVCVGLWILAHPHVSEKRRYTGIFADNAGNTYFMAVSGELGAAVFAIYLFVTFGNGFRYGRRHLFSVAGALRNRVRDRLLVLRLLDSAQMGHQQESSLP